MELTCAVQLYDWGRQGSKSIVAKLAKSANNDFILDEEKSYAELWMGTHKNGPSILKKDGTPLSQYIAKNNHVLGADAEAKKFEDLPFLFKVLSVGKALSIQAHPDKERAKRLHLERPDIYKDPNHKPELAIALSPFEALCGFRPVKEIKRFIETIPEFRTAIELNSPEGTISICDNDDREFVKKSFERILSQEPKIISEQLNRLVDRASSLDEADRDTIQATLLEKLHKDYPGDVGCFGIYFFNYINLKPGDAIYISANEPHAYLSGDCIECMAGSDNVVRAGLTPKLKDVPTLVEMLSYKCESASSKSFAPIREDRFTEVFRPPVPDFAVARIIIPTETESYDLIPRNTASILLIMSGKARLNSSEILDTGSVLFVSANEKITLIFSCCPATIFQAFANESS